MLKRFGAFLLGGMAIFFWQAPALGQIDPETRRLIQLGFNQPLEGKGPIAAYGFFYYNQPAFYRTNLTLRLAIAPIYVDSELGFGHLLGSQTDLGVGLAGGGFADIYSEIDRGVYRKEASFIGHSGEISSSIYHLFNPDNRIPLYGIIRGSVHESLFSRDTDTDKNFTVPQDHTTYHLRTGLRFGGKEPTMNTPLAMELSLWYDGQFRTHADPYGYNGDRQVEELSHQIWSRALLRYTSDTSGQQFDVSLSMGTTVDADRFSAFRLGGMLPFAAEFPLSIPGYYYQELSTRRFVLLNGQYSIPFTPGKHWEFTVVAATADVDYLKGLEQPGSWHSGAGAGITYISPSKAWFVSVVYGYGFDAIRTNGRGANQVSLLFQYDFEAKKSAKLRRFYPGVNPYRSSGGERLFR